MHVLYIAARDPYQSATAQTLLDALLVAASFGAQVSVLFQGPGVLQLQAEQNGQFIDRRSLAAQLGSLPLFDVEGVYADAEDIARYRIDLASAPCPTQAIAENELRQLLAQCDQVIRL